jgi:CBS domain-containing protein
METVSKTVGEVRITNTLSVLMGTIAYDAAVKLLQTGFHGLSVLNSEMKVVGKITELDLLKALTAGQDLKKVRVEQMMSPAPPVIYSETSTMEAVEIMESQHLFRLPVIKGGCFVGNITRHDLLREWLGVWNPWNVKEGDWLPPGTNKQD